MAWGGVLVIRLMAGSWPGAHAQHLGANQHRGVGLSQVSCEHQHIIEGQRDTWTLSRIKGVYNAAALILMYVKEKDA